MIQIDDPDKPKNKDGGWIDGILLKPTWQHLAKILNHSSSEDSIDGNLLVIPIVKPVYRILMKYSKIYIKEKELRIEPEPLIIVDPLPNIIELLLNDSPNVYQEFEKLNVNQILIRLNS